MTKESFLNTLYYNNITEQNIIDLMKNIGMTVEDKWKMLIDLGLNAEEVFQYYAENNIHDNNIKWGVE